MNVCKNNRKVAGSVNVIMRLFNSLRVHTETASTHLYQGVHILHDSTSDCYTKSLIITWRKWNYGNECLTSVLTHLISMKFLKSTELNTLILKAFCWFTHTVTITEYWQTSSYCIIISIIINIFLIFNFIKK